MFQPRLFFITDPGVNALMSLEGSRRLGGEDERVRPEAERVRGSGEGDGFELFESSWPGEADGLRVGVRVGEKGMGSLRVRRCVDLRRTSSSTVRRTSVGDVIVMSRMPVSPLQVHGVPAVSLLVSRTWRLVDHDVAERHCSPGHSSAITLSTQPTSLSDALGSTWMTCIYSFANL